jgi:influenza virus NS1A-binding protein
MNQKRKGCSVVCMPDGLYVLGGYDGCQYLKSVEKFDLSIKKWKYVQDMNYPRCFSSSVNSFDFQYIYTVGGFDGKPLSSVERYDVLSGQWELLKRMPNARYRHQSLFLNE